MRLAVKASSGLLLFGIAAGLVALGNYSNDSEHSGKLNNLDSKLAIMEDRELRANLAPRFEVVTSPISNQIISDPGKFQVVGILYSTSIRNRRVIIGRETGLSEILSEGEMMDGWIVDKISNEHVEFKRESVTFNARIAAAPVKKIQGNNSESKVERRFSPRNYPGPIVTGTPGLD